MAANAPAFDVGDYVVYPKHGVGRVIELQSEEIAGMQLELYVLRFEKERMTLRVPMNKIESIGMRKLSSDKTLKEAMETLKGKPKVKRTMWSRRAQEYEAKINSGDLVSIAEVTRDLFRPEDQPEQSYSERQIFEAASASAPPSTSTDSFSPALTRTTSWRPSATLSAVGAATVRRISSSVCQSASSSRSKRNLPFSARASPNACPKARARCSKRMSFSCICVLSR